MIPGWVQVALFGWMICWGNHPPLAQSSYDLGVEYVAVGTARIDYSKSSPEQSDRRAERARASQFLELVTTVNGVRNWHVTGPDLDGRYGGLNGCGGVEAIYNQSTSSATYLLSDTYGHTEGTLSGTTFTWNPTQCDGYGALPGTTKPSALIAGANVASQLGWRGHYIDPTGFYYLGARYYAPDSGTFLSPDPFGHSASMDLYSYCDGDPVNNFDPDGRSWNQVFGVVRAGGGVGETAAGYTLAAASAGGGIATAPTGVGPVLGVAGVTAGVAIGAHGLDQIQTGLRQAYYDTPTASFTSQGLQSLGMSSQAANLTDASISIVGSIGAGFATTAIRATALTATSTSAQVASSSMLGKIGYYEIGQNSLSGANAATYLPIANTLDRGAAMVAKNGGFLNAAFSTASLTMGASEGTLIGTYGLQAALPTPLGGSVLTSLLSGIGQIGSSSSISSVNNPNNGTSPSGDPLSSRVAKWKN